MMRKYQVRFGGGPTEKGRVDRHLAGGLPYIPPDGYRRWLDNDTPERELKAMLRPFPAEGMTSRLADPRVNKAGVEGPECLGLAG